jgi:hypothetical protein
MVVKLSSQWTMFLLGGEAGLILPGTHINFIGITPKKRDGEQMLPSGNLKVCY